MANTPVMAWGRSTWEHLHALWTAIHFEGHYSVDRLQRLNDYSGVTNRGRVLLVLVLTPLPSLVLSLLKEALPLSPPYAALYHQWVFFIRAWIVTSLIDGLLLLQIRQGVPRLQLKVGSVVFVALLAAGVTMIFIYGICSVFDTFPLPFGILIAAPPNVGVITGCFIYMSRHRWKADPSIWCDVKGQLYMLNSIVVLAFIYPIYIYGHVSLSGIAQASYVLILPVIKLFGKHLINHAFTSQTIGQPEAFVFNVDVLMSLYISSALQTASSWTTVAAIMALDLLHFWQTMIKIRKILGEVDTLLAKIPRGHAMARESFLQVAMRLINLEARQKHRYRKNAVMDLTLKQITVRGVLESHLIIYDLLSPIRINYSKIEANILTGVTFWLLLIGYSRGGLPYKHKVKTV